MSLLDRILECQTDDMRDLCPLLVDDLCVGWLSEAMQARLDGMDDIFRIDSAAIRFAPTLATPAKRSKALAKVAADLHAEGYVPGWRGELCAAVAAFGQKPAFLLERSACAAFGVQRFGCQANGYVETARGIEMWVAQRSAMKAVGPGKWDVFVGGGLPAGLSLQDNLVKELWEEAGVPEILARQAKPVGPIRSIFRDLEDTVPGQPYYLASEENYIYDLKLPEEFVPQNQDGEVAAFKRLPAAEVLAMVSEGEEILDNCNLPYVDFFIRHGLVPRDEPGLPDLARKLKQCPWPYGRKVAST